MLVRACRPPSPRCLRSEVHPSVSFTSSSECCVLRPAPGLTSTDLAVHRSAPEAPPLGFRALFATSAGSVHTRAGCPPRASVRPRRFARPRRFTPPPALRVCFAPLPRTGFALQGIVPRLEHGPVSRTDLPSCRRAPRSAGLTRCPLRPRLQGLAPQAGAVVAEDGKAASDSAPLLGLRLLRVFSPRTVRPAPAF